MSWKIPFSDIQLSTEHHAAKCNFGSTVSLQKSINSIETLDIKQIFIKSGFYKGNRVAIKELSAVRVNLTRPLLLELKAMKELSCDNLVRMLGGCFENLNNCLITEYCSRGSLQDVLENDELKLEDMIKYSLLHDIVKGLTHLHQSDIRIHGNLKSTNCLVDARFVLKIADFGLLSLRHAEEESYCSSVEMHQHYTRKLWSAPEMLKRGFLALSIDQIQKSDIYSTGIIINEIFCRLGTFPLRESDASMTPFDIIQRVTDGSNPVLRPLVDRSVECEMADLMKRCWLEDPNQRPSVANVKGVVRKKNMENESGNILDNLLNRMVLYSENLESLVGERTKDYLEEKRKCEEVLYQLLPQSVACQLIAGKPVVAKTYDAVTIYFSDIVGFTAISASSSPMEVVAMLNSLYSLFDKTISVFDVYKVETIGDAYMVVSGLPVPNFNDHVREVARMALKLLEAVMSFKIPHRPGESMRLRIGLHSGPCVAGVVGLKMPRYCLFGDTVNTASRMESNGLPLKIHVSGVTHALLTRHFPSFRLKLRGDVEMKGKGLVTTYWLESEEPAEVHTTKNHLHLSANGNDTTNSGNPSLTEQVLDSLDSMNINDIINNSPKQKKTEKENLQLRHINPESNEKPLSSSCASSSIICEESFNKSIDSSILINRPPVEGLKNYSSLRRDKNIQPSKGNPSPASSCSSEFKSPKSPVPPTLWGESENHDPVVTQLSNPTDIIRNTAINRSSMKKIVFITDNDINTPLLTNSKTNSMV